MSELTWFRFRFRFGSEWRRHPIGNREAGNLGEGVRVAWKRRSAGSREMIHLPKLLCTQSSTCNKKKQ